MNTQLKEQPATALLPVESINAVEVFRDRAKLEDLLTRIRAETATLVPDITTADGRSYAPEATPEPADEKAKDWIQQADRLERAEEYAPLKAKMMADYGGVVKNIPVPVRLAFSAANARVMPKDEE